MKYLKGINISLSVIHALLAIVIGCIVVPANFGLEFNTRSHSIIGSNQWASKADLNYDQFIKGGLIFFYLWTSLAHALYAIDPKQIYSKSIAKGQTPLRWIEYGVSATVMLAIMIIVSGVKDQHAFSLMIYMSIAIMSTGYWYETTKSLIPILIGFLLLFGISFVIISSFNQRLNEAKQLGASIPDFVYGVVYVMLMFYGIFGFVPLLPLKAQEYTYMALSLIAKTSLGTFLAIGATRAR